ncbi:sugar transferase [uncultured Flavobacterium sp.]|jgi:lipopolysaccharide/colanic/teichoic acid biosynthesis glycosyltransferase|uniref:sugar transferase n=1 Tax=uncultured Flavobacterium sp. TaxID=165435 RepID=UPI0025943429|nr:sugar transferase [uncultured Flavobacterium sp.]
MLFKQTRIGKNGRLFTIYKFRTIPAGKTQSNVWGSFLRKTKLDELPQIINIIKGEMTWVGPRPDIPGYADQLIGEDRIILTVKPGITGLASLKYRNEEGLLNQQLNPLQFNDEIIWPDKVRINKWYVKNKSFRLDCIIIFYTLIPLCFDVDAFCKKYN